MNKRIEELANKAGFEKGDYDMYWDQDGNSEGVDLEKFAKLIIEECIDVVIESDPSPKMIINEPYRSVVENIKDHFGVE